MDDLAQCFLPLWYRLKPDKRKSVLDEREAPENESREEAKDHKIEFLVSPPTVRQAVTLYGLLPNYETPAFAVRIRAIMEEWLSDSGLIEFIDNEEIHIEDQCALLYEFLSHCEPEGFEVSSDANVSGAVWKREGTLSLMLAEYRMHYGGDVLNEPWGLFLNQLNHLEKVKAELGIGNLAWYLAAKSASADAIEKLHKRAGYNQGLNEINSTDEYKKMMEENKRRVQAQSDSAKDLARLMLGQRGLSA